MIQDTTNKDTIADNLLAIDWDFSESKTTYLSHGIHPYPAKFIPQIPRNLIAELSSEGDTIADIFCGSGTTLLEALLLNRNAVGLDANPLACYISDAKTTILQHDDQIVLESLVLKAKSMNDMLKAMSSLSVESSFASKAPRPNHKAIDFWFVPFVVEELAEILSWCNEMPTASSKKIATVAFSSIIVTVSKQDSDTRYVRREKKIAPGDVFARFAKALNSSINSLSELRNRIPGDCKCKVICNNILSQPDIGQVDLIVCSPPYPNAFSYHLYHMTRMIWLDLDNQKFKKEEIGSHRKYSSRSQNGPTIETFIEEFNTIFTWLYEHVKKGRYACFVVGDSTIKGEKVSNANLLTEVARSNGFRPYIQISRHMNDTKKAFNPRMGSIKDEQILVVQRG